MKRSTLENLHRGIRLALQRERREKNVAQILVVPEGVFVSRRGKHRRHYYSTMTSASLDRWGRIVDASLNVRLGVYVWR